MATRQDQIPPENTSEAANNQETDGGDLQPNQNGTTTGAPDGSQASTVPPEVQAELDRLRASNAQLTSAVSKFARRAEASGDAGGRAKPADVPEPAIPDQEFWQSPVKTLEKLVTKAVAPIQQQVATAVRQVQAPDARATAKTNLKYFDQIEGAVDNILEQQGLDPQTATYEEIEFAHRLAIGYAIQNDIIKPGASSASVTEPNRGGGPVSTEQPSGRPHNPAPPQHRPSPAPLPAAQAGKPASRELSENEARLCREQFGGNKEAYLKWLEMDEEEVAVSTFGQETK